MQEVKDKAGKKTSVVKSWKDNILQWGLDSNYNHALSSGGRLNTNGWTGGIYYTRQRSAGKKTVWLLQCSEIRHEKEIKQQRSGDDYRELGPFRPFLAGKLNYVYTLQVGYGREQLLFPALLDGHASVSFRYAAGPSFAVLKPVYLNLIYTEYNPDPVSHIRSEQYDEHNAALFLDPHKILGADKWSRGISESKLIPGLFTEAMFIIDPGRPQAFVKSVTVGGQFAYYVKNIAIMADRKACPYQMCFFVGLNLGKRWK